MRKIAVIGTGYVGLVTGTCLAELGNSVVCVDMQPEKVDLLRKGIVPFFEPGLHELMVRNQQAGRLIFETQTGAGIAGAQIVFIAVGTPMGDDGQADLQYVRAAAQDIAANLDSSKIIVNKSTVPVETGDLVAAIVREHNPTQHTVSVVSNPEFLREGSAIADFMQPDRIVLGVSDKQSGEVMTELYAPLSAPVIITDVRTAEMIKYTANAFLATKISFINEIANVCQQVDADIKSVVVGAGSDKRIGTAFMNAGLGFGGSCFPKDVMALAKFADSHGVMPRILNAVLDVNRNQVEMVMQYIATAIGGARGKRVGVLGLAFKPNTDDVRESPALRLIELLDAAGASVLAHDPVAIETARATLPSSVKLVASAYEAMNDVAALVVATDWNEYKQIDFEIARKLMSGNVLIDARNIYDPDKLTSGGFHYIGIGRSPKEQRISPLLTSDVSA